MQNITFLKLSSFLWVQILTPRSVWFNKDFQSSIQGTDLPKKCRKKKNKRRESSYIVKSTPEKEIKLKIINWASVKDFVRALSTDVL